MADAGDEARAAAGASAWERLRGFRARHAEAESLAFFLGGFAFDAWMVSRIDDAKMLLQQGAYLLAVGLLLAMTLRLERMHLPPPRLLRGVWKWSDPALHFMLGTLLNAYMLFYVKSASGLTAVIVVAVLGAMLAINELPRFHRHGPVVLIGLYSFALTSYFAYLLPVLLGRLRPWMFLAAVGISAVPLFWLARGVRRWSGDGRTVRRSVLLPALLVQVVLLGLFVARLIPPVPLSLRAIGIYHQVVRETGSSAYLLTHQPRSWRFWLRGDQDFRARPGDRIYCFVRIFAPNHFRDRVRVRWEYRDPTQGWLRSDAVPMSITGGREEGFGGFSYKTHYQPGDWRVAVETEDGREIGAMRFSVREDPELDPAVLVVDRG